MRDTRQIQEMYERISKEIACDNVDQSGEEAQIVGVQDALRWVLDTGVGDDWLDGYFKKDPTDG